MNPKTYTSLLAVGALACAVAYGLKTNPRPNPIGSTPGVKMPGVAAPGVKRGQQQPDPIGQTALAAQMSRYEKELCDLANAERRKRGMPLLQISPALSEVARAHSREMAARGYFAHESPTRGLRDPLDRYRARIKKTPRLVAENIYKLEGYGAFRLKPADFRAAHTGWMKSPHHRDNILRTQPQGGPTVIGVGIFARNNAFWATQNFARP